VYVVDEAVENGVDIGRVAEHLAPLGEAAVGGENHRALFVSDVDQLEEQIAAAGRHWQVADLVEDAQRGAGSGCARLKCLRAQPWRAGR
jgi:hypothetical protein